jgi:KipI family sensor histidine kinase inhibitor
MLLYPAFFDCAESALLVDFGPHLGKDVSLALEGIGKHLEMSSLKGFKEYIPALSSITIFYDPLELPREELVAKVEALCAAERLVSIFPRTWEIPVAYGGDGGPDLKDIAERAGLEEDEIVKLHSGLLYHVYMLGFLPGFAYLGDLEERLQFPRRSTPRPRVRAGSVAIASDMTAIYPLESPGGWHLIGYTPVILWDMAREEKPLFRPGDRVRFKPIGHEAASRLRQDVEEGWQPVAVEET